jgi:hypothetical protein
MKRLNPKSVRVAFERHLPRAEGPPEDEYYEVWDPHVGLRADSPEIAKRIVAAHFEGISPAALYCGEVPRHGQTLRLLFPKERRLITRDPRLGPLTLDEPKYEPIRKVPYDMSAQDIWQLAPDLLDAMADDALTCVMEVVAKMQPGTLLGIGSSTPIADNVARKVRLACGVTENDGWLGAFGSGDFIAFDVEAGKIVSHEFCPVP